MRQDRPGAFARESLCTEPGGSWAGLSSEDSNGIKPVTCNCVVGMEGKTKQGDCIAVWKLSVKIGFGQRAWDVYITLGYVLVVSAFLLILNIGTPLAVLLVLFAPGYLATSAIFPRKNELEWTERIVLSLGVSIAVVPLLVLGLNFTPLGIRFGPIVSTIGLFSAFVGYAAHLRRMRLPPEERLSASMEVSMPTWQGYTSRDKVLAIALASAVVLAAGSLVYVVLIPRVSETFTEFYLVGPSGNASGYPTALNVSQPATVTVGIVNHEAASVNYTIRIDLVGVRLVYNVSSGFNETVEINRTTWSTFDVNLAKSQNWTQPYTFRINATGFWKVQFLLFRDGAFPSVYRELHLFVRVS